jgi:hypothetical protein
MWTEHSSPTAITIRMTDQHIDENQRTNDHDASMDRLAALIREALAPQYDVSVDIQREGWGHVESVIIDGYLDVDDVDAEEERILEIVGATIERWDEWVVEAPSWSPDDRLTMSEAVEYIWRETGETRSMATLRKQAELGRLVTEQPGRAHLIRRRELDRYIREVMRLPGRPYSS